MGYLGTLNFNGLHRTEHKFCGDYFSSYAQMYSTAKPCEVDANAVNEVLCALPEVYTDFAYRISEVSTVIHSLGSFIGRYFYNSDYFDSDGKFIGTKRVYMFNGFETVFFLCDHDISILDKAGFTNEDQVSYSETSIKWPSLFEKGETLKLLSWKVRKIDIISPLQMCYDSSYYNDLYERLLSIDSRDAVISIINELTSALNKLVSMYNKMLTNIQDVSTRLSGCLNKLTAGEKLFAVIIGGVVKIKDVNDAIVFEEKPLKMYPYSSLFAKAGTDCYGSQIEITNKVDMEFFISLFNTRTNRDFDLENAIIEEYENCLNNDIPIKFSLGGSY